MRKTRVLLFLFILLGAGLFAQSENKIVMPVGNEELLQQINSLKEKASNVNAAYDNVRAASTGSRSSAALAVTALNDACNAYIAEMNKQQPVASADVKFKKDFQEAIAREIAAVKKIQSDYCPTGK